MMILYAVAAADAESTDGTPLQAHRSGALTVFLESRQQRPERSTGELLAFGRLLHQLWAYVPVLPMRFGTVVNDSDELDQLVAARESEWAGRLAAVTGRSECIVHIPRPVGAAAGEQTGTDYLRRRAMEVKQHDTETAELKALLAPYASETTMLAPTRPQESRLSLLVPDEEVEAARTAIQDWAANRSGVAVTGPWPPFSFCQEAGE